MASEKIIKGGKNNNIFSRKTIIGVLAFVFAAGGYGGYEVVKTYGKYGTDFEKRLHIVEEVVDGDTIIIEDKIRVRLLGIDAPEQKDCFGEDSKAHLMKLLLGQEIFLEKDQIASDEYGRLLRYVILHNENPEIDDMLINVELIRDGFAKSVYVKPNRKYLSQFQSVEAEALASKSGMWGACEYESEPNLEREMESLPDNKDCIIKASINKRYERDYFLPGCPDYKRVKVDPRKGEKWFCTEDEAKADGWKRSDICNNLSQNGY